MTKKDFKEAIKQTLKQIPEDYAITSINIETSELYSTETIVIIAVEDILKFRSKSVIAKSPLSYSHGTIKYK